MTTSTADLWHHYGRARTTGDRTVSGTFRWSWGQDAGPGPEVLGDLTGRRVGDLGAGTSRHAAHLAVHQQPAQVIAIDASHHEFCARWLPPLCDGPGRPTV